MAINCLKRCAQLVSEIEGLAQKAGAALNEQRRDLIKGKLEEIGSQGESVQLHHLEVSLKALKKSIVDRTL